MIDLQSHAFTVLSIYVAYKVAAHGATAFRIVRRLCRRVEIRKQTQLEFKDL